MEESETSGENSKINYRSGRKRPPLDLRLKLFVEVLGLRNKSYTYSEIEAKIAKRYGVSLAKGTISSWVRRINSPFNSGHMFVPKPTPELAYVIGVETGDASLNAKLKTYQYRVRLQAVDREFVEAFSRGVARVLGCVPHRLWKGHTARETHVEYGSYLLHKFLQQPFETLKPFIEHSKRCVAAFLRGFFDSEGSVDTNGRLSASNTNLSLLGYVRYLLSAYFGMETGGPYLGSRKGSLMVRRGKSYARNSDCYSIVVKNEFLRGFYTNIGMTIVRKRLRVEKVLGLCSSRQKR